MQITDDELHQTLKYVVSVCDAGYGGFTPEQVEAFQKDRPTDPAPVMRSIASVFEAFLEGRVRPHWERLLSLGWVTLTPLRPTDLGRAVLTALERDERVGGTDDVSEVLLDADDELVLSRLVGQLAEVGEYLLVDPYLRVDSLPPLMRRTKLRRALVSDRLGVGDQAALADYVERLSDGLLEIRVLSHDQLHDRYVIADKEVLQLGTSMNGVGRTTTVLAKLRDVSVAVRAHYEQLWIGAGGLDTAALTTVTVIEAGATSDTPS